MLQRPTGAHICCQHTGHVQSSPESCGALGGAESDGKYNKRFIHSSVQAQSRNLGLLLHKVKYLSSQLFLMHYHPIPSRSYTERDC